MSTKEVAPFPDFAGLTADYIWKFRPAAGYLRKCQVVYLFSVLGNKIEPRWASLTSRQKIEKLREGFTKADVKDCVKHGLQEAVDHMTFIRSKRYYEEVSDDKNDYVLDRKRFVEHLADLIANMFHRVNVWDFIEENVEFFEHEDVPKISFKRGYLQLDGELEKNLQRGEEEVSKVFKKLRAAAAAGAADAETNDAESDSSSVNSIKEVERSTPSRHQSPVRAESSAPPPKMGKLVARSKKTEE